MVTLVTGATGHIGINLVRDLLAHGRRVRILVHRRSWPLENLAVESLQGDIRDMESLRRAFQGVDSVFHLAAHVSISGNSWTDLENTNILGTRNIIELCLSAGVRLVHFSSIHAYLPESRRSLVDESCSLAESPHCPGYDRSKAGGEQQVRLRISRGLNAVIVNPTAAIGPYDFEPSLFGEALLAMARGKLPVSIAGGFDWVDARDIATGAIQAEELGTPGSRYLLSGHRASVTELASLVEEFTGAPAPRLVCPIWLASAVAPAAVGVARLMKQRPLFTADSMRALRHYPVISHEKATHDLGYSPRPLRDTIADTLQWFASNGKIKKPLAGLKA